MASQPSSGDEQTLAFVVGAVVLAVAFFVITRMQEETNAISGAISWFLLWPHAAAVRQFPVLETLPMLGSFFRDAGAASAFLEAGNFAYMSAEQRSALLSLAGRAAWPVLIPFMVWAAFAGRAIRVDQAHKKAYTLDTMIHTQSEHWTTSRAVRHVNPLEQPEVSAGALAKAATEGGCREPVGQLIVDPGRNVAAQAWQRAMRPEEWLVATGLTLDPKVIESAEQADWRLPDREMEARHRWRELDLHSLMEVLSGQLGRPWSGYGGLRPCLKALSAAMAAFHDYDLETGRELLDDLGRLVDSIQARPGLDAAIMAEDGFIDRVERILETRPGQGLLEVANRHAWLESAFPSMLAAARFKRGVLPPATFLWLKAEDRPLWYVLDSVGSEAIMVEAAGAMAHYRAEVQIGAPVRRPAVYQAARALLEDYLDITPERVKRRLEMEERARPPAAQIDAALASAEAPGSATSP